MKKFFRTIHLYLSLIAGLFIVLAAVTGSIMVFEDEINHTFYAERYFVESGGLQKKPITELIKVAENATKGAKASGVKVYNLGNRTVEISLTSKEKPSFLKEQQPKLADKKSKKPGFLVYVNPYTGKIIATVKSGDSFFKKVEMIHRFLLSKKGGIGNYVMSYSSVFFFFILVTGVILWWPKSNKILKQRLKVKWDGKTKRLVHDLHVVVGFYTSVFLIVIVGAGLIMAFPAINSAIFKLTKSKIESPKLPKSNFVDGVKPVELTALTQLVEKTAHNWESYNFKLPKDKEDVISVSILEKGALENKANTYYFDQFSGKQLGTLAFADKNLGQRIRSYIKPVHTGELFGLPTKILSFIISLLTITFPITGVIMWLNRLKKTKDVAN